MFVALHQNEMEIVKREESIFHQLQLIVVSFPIANNFHIEHGINDLEFTRFIQCTSTLPSFHRQRTLVDSSQTNDDKNEYFRSFVRVV